MANELENRIPTGIFGLDQIVSGGFRDKTAVVVVGASGTGKSTFAMQFLMHGIKNGEQGLYVTMEESPNQIINEADLLGFEMEKHFEKELFFIHLKGRNFKDMINEQLPKLVKARQDYAVKTRVAIDPMTPVIWAVTDKQDQRELVGKLFTTLKNLGVVMATVEEHTKPGETIGEDVLLPIYLADAVIHLDYHPIGGAFNRTLQIIKMRGSAHGEGVYPYIFARGAGVIARTSGEEIRMKERKNYDQIFDDAIATAKQLNAPEFFIRKLEYMKINWIYEYSPEESLQLMFSTFGLKK
ncbi:MAG: circadian clock protein KaiC [Thermoplasmata archaeon]|nr:circadian clock protein KaiC [Thermoplasmata archaeon]